ncbi:MAG: acyltransferase family protein [Candidatus Hodarchaeota archaeon]
MENTIKKERSYELDWLRIIATILIFFFHSARPFNYWDWEIKNNETDIGLSLLIYYIDYWVIPIFFIIAGMGTFYALGVRKGNVYVKERFKRLMIPLIIGMFTHAALQVYIARLTHGDFQGSFIEFYLYHYFNGVYMGPSNPETGNFNVFGGHMWYLLFLFFYSVILLKIFQYLRKEENSDKLTKWGAFFKKPGALYLLVIPIFLVEEATTPLGLPPQGGYQVFTYIVIFLYGFLLVSNDEFREAIERHGIPSLIIAIVLLIILGISDWTRSYSLEPLTGLLRSICGWSWVIAVIHLGRKFLYFNHKSLKFLNDIVLPFYILHQSVILVVAFYVLPLDLITTVKYFIICSVSFVIIMGLILIIRKVNVLRFLFGMRLKKKE